MTNYRLARLKGYRQINYFFLTIKAAAKRAARMELQGICCEMKQVPGGHLVIISL